MLESNQENRIYLDLQFFGGEESEFETSDSETPIAEEDFDEDFFFQEDEDEGEEEQKEPEEPQQEQEKSEKQEETEPQQPIEEEEPLTARFLGKDIPLPASAAKEIAGALGVEAQDLISTIQKGLNYDHVAQKAQEVAGSREMQMLDSMAQEYGMSREQYLDMLQQNSGRLAVQQEIALLRARYPEAPEDLLQQTAQGILQQRQAQEQERRRQEELQRQQQERQRREPWEELFSLHPELLQDPKAIPREVMARIQAGVRPLAAYQEHVNRQLQLQLQAKAQNQKNLETTPGPMKGDAAPAAVDPFLEGFGL